MQPSDDDEQVTVPEDNENQVVTIPEDDEVSSNTDINHNTYNGRPKRVEKGNTKYSLEQT